MLTKAFSQHGEYSNGEDQNDVRQSNCALPAEELPIRGIIEHNLVSLAVMLVPRHPLFGLPAIFGTRHDAFIYLLQLPLV